MTFLSTSRPLLLLLALSTLLSSTSADKKCYAIDGSEVDDTHRPCNPDADVSACCATNKEGGDVCLSSGLCYSQMGAYQGFIFADGCTDSSGKSKECPHVCPDRTNDWKGGDPTPNWNVLQCNLTTFCCRHPDDGQNCCNDPSAVVKDFYPGTLILSSVVTSTYTGTAVSTSGIPSATRSQTSNPAETTCPKDNSAIVGGAVGGVLGAGLLGALGVIALLLRRGRRRDAALNEKAPPAYMNSRGSARMTKTMHQTYELDHEPIRHEI